MEACVADRPMGVNLEGGAWRGDPAPRLLDPRVKAGGDGMEAGGDGMEAGGDGVEAGGAMGSPRTRRRNADVLVSVPVSRET